MTKATPYTTPAASKPRRVAMLIYPGVTPLDVAGPLEVFSFANILRKQEIYDVVTVGPTAGPVTTKAGIAFLPSCAMTELALPVDTLMVAGGGKPRTWITQEMIDWLEPRQRRLVASARSAPALFCSVPQACSMVVG